MEAVSNQKKIDAICNAVSDIKASLRYIENQTDMIEDARSPDGTRDSISNPWITISTSDSDQGWITFPLSEVIAVAHDGESTRIRLGWTGDKWVELKSHEMAMILDLIDEYNSTVDVRLAPSPGDGV